MDFAKVVYQRRSVRDYTDQVVSEDTVDELLDAAIQAPSAMNEQPWAFVVIQDKELLKQYSEKAKPLVLNSPQVATKKAELRAMLAAPQFNIFYNSSTLIVIYAKPIGQHPDWDCCLAGENLMLAAEDKGLATCPIGLAWPLFDQSEVKRELKVPEDYVGVLPIIVGYPAQTPMAPARKKPEILCWK
jgi:nitroreductase